MKELSKLGNCKQTFSVDTILWEILISDRICDFKLTLMCSGYSWVQDTHGYRIVG